MCGIVGVAGTVGQDQKRAFQQLMLVNSNRGLHGAGIASLYGWGKKTFYNIGKTLEPSSIWVWTKEYESHTNDYGMHVLMGHSRYATQGGIKIENNHPFLVKDRHIGMHNGTISGKFQGRDNFGTDSEALVNLISSIGLKKALEDVYATNPYPAYALALLNLQTEVVTLIRNDKRPLYLGLTNEAIFWASQANFLDFAFTQVGIKNYSIQEIPVHARVTIYHSKPAKERLKIALDFFTPPAPKPVVTGGQRQGQGTFPRGYEDYAEIFGYSPLGDFRTDTGGDRPAEDPAVSKPTTEQPVKPTKGAPDVRPGKPSRMYLINKQLFHKNHINGLLQRGCSICGSPQFELDRVRFSPRASEELYCHDCADTLESIFHMKWDECSKAVPYLTQEV